MKNIYQENIFEKTIEIYMLKKGSKSRDEGRGVIEQNGFTSFYFSPSSMTWGTCTVLVVLSRAEPYHDSD